MMDLSVRADTTIGRLRVLHLDDDFSVSPRVARLLAEAGIPASVDFVCNEEHLSAALEAAQHDLILTDLSPRWLRGVDVLEMTQRRAPNVPVVILTDVRGEEVAVDCIRRGAADFVLKSRPSALGGAVQRALLENAGALHAPGTVGGRHVEREPLGLEEETLKRHIGRALSTMQRSPQYQAALIVIEFSAFFLKHAGLVPSLKQEIVRLLASRIRQLLRPGDVICQLAPASLAVLLDDLRRHEDTFRVLGKLDDIVGLPVSLGAETVEVSAAVGITALTLEPHGLSPLERAQQAARSAETRLNHIAYGVCDSSLLAGAQRSTMLERDLRVALDKGELFCHYQPIVSAKTLAPFAMEALVRWCHPVHGFVSPLEFVGVAESSGLIHQLGRFVLESGLDFLQACRQTLPDLRLNVNVSPLQLSLPGFAETLFELLKVSACPPENVVLEMTEAGLVEAVGASLAALEALFSGGLQIAVDDFGVGYSSLSYLRDFPVTALKIDRSFTERLPNSKRDGQIVTAVAQLAHNLGFYVTAEGVETEEQAAFLRQENCDFLQGYLYSRPVAPAEILGWMRAHPGAGSGA